MAKLKTKFIEDSAVTSDKINDGAITSAKLNATLDLPSGTTRNGQDLIDAADLGAANGVATLDGGGKIPASQLPNSVMDYRGNWAASTNTPTLADGVGSAGDVYKASDAGTVDFGSGAITFAAGDWAVYNGTIWEKSLNTNDVTSVNGQSGTVVLDTDDISEGAANFYYTEARFDSSLSGKSTTDLSEGTNLYYTQARFDAAFTAKSTSDLSEGTNLYFTDARAKSATVDDTAYDAGTWDAVTDVAPSKNAVRDKIEDLQSQINAATGSSQGREVLTLNGTDISNGFVDLAQPALASSIQVTPVGGLEQEPGIDFTEALTGGAGGNTRITFAGDLAAELIAGDKLIIYYEY